MIREAVIPPLDEPCGECGRSYIHAMSCSKFFPIITPQPKETVPMTQVTDIKPETPTGECAKCGWFGGHDTTCEEFREDTLTLDGSTGGVIEATVDGEPALIKNVTPEPRLPIAAPTVADAIEQLMRAQTTLDAARSVTTRAKDAQKSAQAAVDTAVSSVVEAYDGSRNIPLPLEPVANDDDEDDDDAVE